MPTSEPPTIRPSAANARALEGDAGRYLIRATWLLAAALGVIAASLWGLQIARTGRTRHVARDATVSRLALAAQQLATDRELETRAFLTTGDPRAVMLGPREEAALTATIDSLASLTTDDPAQHDREASLATAISRWDSAFVTPALAKRDRAGAPLAGAALVAGLTRFDSVRAGFSRFLIAEDSVFEIRLQSAQRLQSLTMLAVAGSFVVVLVMFGYMRRRLGREIEHAAEQRRLIESQNRELRAQRDDLTAQTTQLQDQAVEMEAQAAELEDHSTELAMTIKRLNESERRLAEAQQIAEIGTWEVDPMTRDVFWSEEMYRLLETTPNDFAPSFEAFMERVHEDDRSLVRSKMGKAMRGEGAFSEEIRVHRPDGSIRRLLTRGDLVTWHGVGRRKVVGTAQDITERKRAEKELHDTEARLRQAQKMEAVGQLAGGLAHDFNNLLTVILSYSAMLLAAPTESDETTGSLREIKGAAERAAALTRQLLAFTRQQLLQPRLLDLNETVTNVDRMLRRLITENIDVRTVLSTALGFVKADPGQIEQVLINLAVNARDAMRDGGTLTIETADVELDGSYVHQGAVAKAGPYVMLAVTDTGTGIPPDIRERIFEPFFTTKAQGHGTGLGLSTVHGIVEQSGGHVWVYSELGIGTTFKVYLPRVAHEHADAQRPAVAPAAKRGTETVLLVEDDAAVRSVASRVLSRAGYTVVEAANGAEAIRLCDDPARVFDLIVSDMVMPGMSGPDLARELRARRPKAGILLMSGYTRDAVVRDGLLRNESFFIEKPFTPDALLRTVRDILDHAPAHPVASS